jgi:hypothetical protein
MEDDMVATFLGVLSAIALIVCANSISGFAAGLYVPDTALFFFFVVSLFFSALPWVWTLFLTLGSENNAIEACSLRSNIHDRRLYVYAGGVILSSLTGLIVVSQELVTPIWVLGCSGILIGLVLDFLRLAYFRLHYRRSAEGIADWFIETMKRAVRKRDERLHTMTFEMVFAVIIAYMQSSQPGELRLFCQKIVGAADLWLGAIARLRMFRLPSEGEESLLDRYSVAEAMTAKRLSWLVKESGDIGSPMAFEEAVRFTGRLFMAFHNFHPSLGFLLLFSLSQTSQKMEGKLERWDRDLEVSIGFSEVVKSLIDRSLDRGVSDKDSIMKVLSILETHVKVSFRQEKNMNPAFLMQPFAEIGQMLGDSRYNALPDRDEILAQLRKVLAQFAAIENVSGRLEITGAGTDTKASFREDLPFAGERKKPPESAQE